MSIPFYLWEEEEDADDLALLPADLAQRIADEDPEALRRLPYAEYLNTAHWDHTRRRALHRAGNQCQRCERTFALQVHHRHYDRLGCEGEGDLEVLCRVCHAKEHGVDDPTARLIELDDRLRRRRRAPPGTAA